MTNHIHSYEHAREQYSIAMHALVEAYSTGYADPVRGCMMANEAHATISRLESRFPELSRLEDFS